jgi:hypothetical protein
MLAHTGGAAALDVPTWLLAYGAAAVVLVVTAGLRGRLVVDTARWDRGEPDRTADDDHAPGGGRHGAGAARVGRVVWRVLGLGTLGLVVAAALVGPEASAANLAPSSVLVVWWVGLPLACAVAGDVMAWLDPFGTLTRAASRALGRSGTAPAARVTALTAAAFLGAFTLWAAGWRSTSSAAPAPGSTWPAPPAGGPAPGGPPRASSSRWRARGPSWPPRS